MVVGGDGGVAVDSVEQLTLGRLRQTLAHDELGRVTTSFGVWTGTYTGGLGERQLKFLENLLPHIPEHQLILFMMHIPLMGTQDRERLYRLIEHRPYTMSIAGHTHWQAHLHLGEKDGWRGAEPHHHVVNVTVSGSWWSGEPDELGAQLFVVTGRSACAGHALRRWRNSARRQHRQPR
jgi:3',5'-cyclic AMP phosphodiesterase CpdA